MFRRQAGVVVVLVLLAGTAGSIPFVTAGGTATDRPTASPDGVPSISTDSQRSERGDLACPRRVTGSDTAVTEARIVELYPNPMTHEDIGEFLVIETPPDTRLENLTLTDGHTTAQFPNKTVTGRIAVTTAPNATRTLTDDPVITLDGTIRLAVDGDELELRNGSMTVDRVAYEQAPPAEQWYRTGKSGDRGSNASGRGTWWPRGATCRPVSRVGVATATTFVLPDAPDIPRETIRSADTRLLLAGYTFTDKAITAELVAAAERGVDVAVLLEASPVGGTPDTTRSRLETLERNGVDVRVIGGESARYRFHHAKYAVADDTLVVMTENWKPSGVGGESSRGWGVRLENETLADDLATVFRADFEGWDTQSSEAYRANTSFVDDDPTPPQEFPVVHEPSTVRVDTAELLLAPDNAEPRLRNLLAEADDEILIKQASIDADVSLLEETLAAARRGVDVRILLDSTWYVEDQHRALAATLERTAAQEDLPLKVSIAGDTDRFEKIHAKGIVIDRRIAIVGSANWNRNSIRNNREVLLVLHGSAVANYYAAVFEGDWKGDTWTLPISFSTTVVAALVGAAVVGYRSVRFGEA